MTRPTGGQSAVPSHQGILREEVLALRHILGSTDYTETSEAFAVPDLGACLPGSQMKDILLVAIDVDVPQSYAKDKIDHQLLHIGVSILDTRRMQKLADDPEEPALSPNIIENHQFAIGGSRRPELTEKASKRFLSGESVLLDRTQVRTQLENLVAGRNFATVFDSTKLDLEVLNDLGVDLPLRGVYMFDTNKVAQWPLQLHYRLNLEKLCTELNVPFALGHTAGNDSHFTLRALLMLAVKDAHRLQQMHGCTISEDLLWKMRRIALAPIPVLEPDQPDQLLPQQNTKRQEAEKQLLKKLEKKAMKEARKQLRRQARTDVSGNSVTDEEASRSALFAEKYQELVQFHQLPQATKKEVRKQQREAMMAQQQEKRTAREAKNSDGPSLSDLNAT